jgi:hypothetical protein
MPLHVTKGGLERAKIVNTVTKDEVPCMFNPHEYTLTKQNSWEKKPVKGKNVPQVTFKQGGSQVLKLTLHFDSLMEDKDVRSYTDPLWKMMMVDDKKKNKETGKSEPPEVAFEWGRLQFKAVLTNMSQKFTLFKSDGTPVRCTVDITLEQMIDVDDYKKEGIESLATSEAAPEEVTATEGDRLDNTIAKVSEEGIADMVRKIAEKNGIDNPLNIAAGLKINI